MTYSKPEVLKMVWAHCLDCCCGERKEVTLCPCKKCPVWPIRNRKAYKTRESETQDNS